MSSSPDHIDELLSGVGADDAKALRKEFDRMREEIEMLEFRLKRMEKIKRTTAIFLDESVAELEEKRKAVEEVNARLEDSLRELKATQAQLVEQEKLASLGSLTAGIAHEIKNPLNFVNNFAEVSEELLEELAEAMQAGNADETSELLAELKENARQVAKHGGRADAIVQSMMQHARGGAAEREPVDVYTFVDEYIDLAWHGMRAKDLSFDCDVERMYSEEAGTVVLQPQDMGRVLLNLLGNAFYATRMEGAAPHARVLVTTSRREDHVVITVEDSGPGIPDDIREKIFEPFFTTKPTGEGTGLGLSLSHDIVTKGHGGSMTVEEAPGGGARFVVRIPVAMS